MQHSEFDSAWREFIEADAGGRAPARIREEVMAAWDARRVQPARGDARPRRRVSFVAVACGAAAVAFFAMPRVSRETPPRGPVVRMVADPLVNGEPLELVRVRLPGSSLDALGITGGGHDLSSLIEVDVVVGTDGLPLEIHG